MGNQIAFSVFFFITLLIHGQQQMDSIITALNSTSVHYVEISEITAADSLVFLDTRSKEEFVVSHIKNALWVGYTEFDRKSFKKAIPDKTTPIVVYCSIGVRSEDIGEKLIKLGYTNVRNLYGGIFKWVNEGHPVVDNDENVTEKVHAFDKFWGILLTKGIKVYE